MARMAKAVMVMATVAVAEMAAFQEEYGAQSVRISPVITSHTRTFRAPVSDEVISYMPVSMGMYQISEELPSLFLPLKTNSKLTRLLFLSDLNFCPPTLHLLLQLSNNLVISSSTPRDFSDISNVPNNFPQFLPSYHNSPE
jgi:hypothetical protein